MESRFLIGIFHADRYPWSKIVRDGQIPTWVNSASGSADIYYCSGKGNHTFFIWLDTALEKLRWNLGARISNMRSNFNLLLAMPFYLIQPKAKLENRNIPNASINNLITSFPDLYVTTRWRRIALMKYFLKNTNFEFLVTSTSSSYINLKALNIELNSKNAEILYGGAIQYPGTSEEYAMGSFIVINRNAAELLLANLKKYPVQMLDDIGLGKAARALGIKATVFNSLSITNTAEIADLSKDQLKFTSHYKLKSGDLTNRNDVEIFHQLHQKVMKTVGNKDQ